MKTAEMANIILKGLEKQTFFDWYNNAFNEYICEEANCSTREQILADIVRLFRLDSN